MLLARNATDYCVKQASVNASKRLAFSLHTIYLVDKGRR